MFGVGESICSEVCLEVAQSICEEFGQQFLGTPSHEDLKRQAQLFETELGYPMCIGERDGSHIPIRRSFEEERFYGASKGFIVLQIVAGADYRILAATMGHAGNTHDSTIMKNHSFWKNREDIFPPGSRVIEGVRIPYLETGDSAFKPTPTSMKPCTHKKRTDAQAYYNYRHSSARMVVEQTFGLLKGRFRILWFTNESSIPTVNAITMACCILHNICIVREVAFKYEWILARKDIHKLDNSEDDDVDVVERNVAGASDAKEIRKALTSLFESQM
ncbi:Protein ALP1-like [Acropora cervicornis]|uniref:Protein ALP1-like n=1 Tax=Acropora cervicornis TaxID=6130 RepID=A0AAD9VG95_ACRCE|nr:Protein ALP1-like [Acropora cervicornis]